MFTGIVEATAQVKGLDGRVLEISKALDVEVGDSVAVDGVCLTASEVDAEVFRASVSEETLARTTLGGLEAGSRVNLERAMPATGRFGGHIVQGHVDALAYMLDKEKREGSLEMIFEAPSDLGRYIVEKGSVALDGVSLTVSGVERDRFKISVIPHTLETTHMADKRAGDPFNLEVDLIAKYVEKLLGQQSAGRGAETPPADDLLFSPGAGFGQTSSAQPGHA